MSPHTEIIDLIALDEAKAFRVPAVENQGAEFSIGYLFACLFLKPGWRLPLTGMSLFFLLLKPAALVATQARKMDAPSCLRLYVWNDKFMHPVRLFPCRRLSLCTCRKIARSCKQIQKTVPDNGVD